MAVYGSFTLFKRRGRWYGQCKRKDGAAWRTMQHALKDADGAPIPCDAEGNRNIRTARAALASWRAEIEGAKPRAGLDADMDMGAYLEAHVARRSPALAASTARTYREYAGMCKPYLKGIRVRDLDGPAVRAALLSMADDGWKPATVRKAYALISQACAAAVEAGDMPANPCTRALARTSIRKAGAADANALDAEGMRAALDAADAYGSPALACAVRLALWAGLRRGEICGLTWHDIDLRGRVLHVRRAAGVRDGGSYLKEPKSAAGLRAVPISAPLADYLAGMRAGLPGMGAGDAASGDSAAPCGHDAPDIGNLFVLTGKAAHMSPHSLSRAWQRATDSAPIMGHTGARASFHDLRHTFATAALSAGVDVRTLAALLGHEDPSVTLRHYAAFMPAQGRAAVDAVALAVQGA